MNTGLTNTTVQSLAMDRTDSNILYAGTAGGVFKSIDGGASWRAINTSLTNLDVRALAIDPLTATNLYAGTFGGGVYDMEQVGKIYLPAILRSYSGGW